MGIRRSGYKITSAWAFTDARYHTAGPDDYTEYHGVRFSQSEGKTLWIPIETTHDTRPEPNETFAIGFWDGGVWHHCVVTIVDDDTPSILNVDLITKPLDSWAYRAGQNIDVTVTFEFSTRVVVNGEVCMEFYLSDGINTDDSLKQATYLGGSGTRTLEFGYTVRSGDMDYDGIGLTQGSDARGFCGEGSIEGEDSGVRVNPWYLGTGPQYRHRIDTEPPEVRTVSIVSSPTNGKAYATGETISIEVVISEHVIRTGAPYLDLEVGEATRRATFSAEGGASNRLLFEYEVQSGDSDADGVGIGANSVQLDGGETFDPAGNNASVSHAAVDADTAHRVDG